MQTSAIMFQAIIQFITGDAIEQSAKTYVNGFISESFAMHLHLHFLLIQPVCPFLPNMVKCFLLKFMSKLHNATCNMKKIISPVIFFLYIKAEQLQLLTTKLQVVKSDPATLCPFQQIVNDSLEICCEFYSSEV